jgi:uncharacterized MAPEG superfamily protein
VKFTPELYSLAIISTATALMWVPYVTARMTTFGVIRAIGVPGPDYPTDALWADRARRAHLNAIENLAVFAPLVLVSAIIELSTRVTVLSAQIYVVARLALPHLRHRHSGASNRCFPRRRLCDTGYRDGIACWRKVDRDSGIRRNAKSPAFLSSR